MVKYANCILFILFVNITAAQIIQRNIQSESSVGPFTRQEVEQEPCKCENSGECYSLKTEQSLTEYRKQVYCRCSSFYIGQNCQFQAYELSTIREISQKINIHQYKYFYYEPIEQNMYSFSFELCFDTKNSSKPNEQKPLLDQVTFFFTTQNQNGGFQNDEEIMKPTTIDFEPDECKKILIDYNVLLITKAKTIQKFIFAIKIGQKLNNPIKSDPDIEQQKSKMNLKQNEKQTSKKSLKNNDPMAINYSGKINQITDSSDQTQLISDDNKIFAEYHPISFTISSIKKKSPPEIGEQSNEKETFKIKSEFKTKYPSKLNQNDDSSSTKTINISFVAYPFMVQFVVFNILFSLTTLAAFIIVGVMIFVIRSRILGIRITRSFGVSSRLINDLRHFERYIPEEKFIKKERKEGDNSPNSSEIECAICLVKFQEMDTIRKTPCSHAFHKSCIDSWCYENLTCPMCRKSLTEKNMAEIFNSTALELKNSPQSDE